MSDALAIAAVTATLRNLLDQGLKADVPGTEVTTRPLDKARANTNGNQVNLFLYHAALSPAWRNMDVPWRTKPGETGQPPLGLNLYYLVTAYYGEAEDGADTHSDPQRLLGSHRLLGRAMSILHDHPVLDAAAIHAILPPDDRLEHPYDQVERVRITSQPLSLDEMSKLWTGFQTQYRLSAAYEVSVVLIESGRPARTPLPVLTRGPEDEGVAAQPELVPPFPALESVHPPNRQPRARLGDVLTINGHHLDGTAVAVRFGNPRLTADVPAQVLEHTATEIRVKLLDADDDPVAPARWVAGVYTLVAVVSRAGEPDRTTNALPFSLAPRILGIAPDPAPRDAGGDVALTVTCRPEVRPEQRAALLLADREIPAQPHPAQTDTLVFPVTAASPGEHFVRLRVDGVDSLLVDRSVTPPAFDESQRVTIV